MRVAMAGAATATLATDMTIDFVSNNKGKNSGNNPGKGKGP
jgi:hypothetical protein